MHHFTLILSGVTEMTSDIANALFDAGIDDGSPASCDGVARVDFHREAGNLAAAIRSAVADVARAGYGVDRVEIAHDFLAELLRGSKQNTVPQTA